MSASSAQMQLSKLMSISLRIHKCKFLNLSFETTNSPGVPQAVWETLDMHIGWASCLHSGHFTNTVTVSVAAGRLQEKFHLLMTSCFWRGSYCPLRWGSNNHHAEIRHFWAQTSISAAPLSTTFGLELCITFWLGLTCYPHGSVHRSTGCFWWKCYQNSWRKSPCHSGGIYVSSKTGLRLISHIRSEKISPPFTTIAGLEAVGL
jgi:hypothetical protein